MGHKRKRRPRATKNKQIIAKQKDEQSEEEEEQSSDIIMSSAKNRRQKGRVNRIISNVSAVSHNDSMISGISEISPVPSSRRTRTLRSRKNIKVDSPFSDLERDEESEHGTFDTPKKKRVSVSKRSKNHKKASPQLQRVSVAKSSKRHSSKSPPKAKPKT